MKHLDPTIHWPPVGIAGKVANLATAGMEIAAAFVADPSAPVLVPPDVLAARDAACVACEFNTPAGNLGLGECKHPGCGCTRFKRNFAAMHCPLTPPKWGTYTPPPA